MMIPFLQRRFRLSKLCNTLIIFQRHHPARIDCEQKRVVAFAQLIWLRDSLRNRWFQRRYMDNLRQRIYTFQVEPPQLHDHGTWRVQGMKFLPSWALGEHEVFRRFQYRLLLCSRPFCEIFLLFRRLFDHLS